MYNIINVQNKDYSMPKTYDIIERNGVVGIITNVNNNHFHIMFEDGRTGVDMAVYSYRDILMFRVIG